MFTLCADEAPNEKQKPQVLTNKNLGQVDIVQFKEGWQRR